MQAIRETVYFDLGGQKRPARFNTTNQTAEFCDIRGIDYPDYAKVMTEKGLQNPSVIRDLIYSALFAGAVFEGNPTDFNKYVVGEWIDNVSDSVEFMKQVGQAIAGTANPNAKAQAKTAKAKN